MIRDQLPFSHLISNSSLIHQDDAFQFKVYLIEFENADIKLLITDGMRNTLQQTDEANNDLTHIELYFCLPSYFNLSKDTWPVDWLVKIARVPQKNNTWFGYGDTIPAGNPPQEISEQLKTNHFILSRPIRLNQYLSLNNIQPTDFKLLAVIPIFQNELDFKMRNSHTILFKKFNEKSHSEKVDVYRKSCCRRRILGLF